MKPILISSKPEHVEKILNSKKTIEIRAPYLPKFEYILIPISTWQETLYGALGGEVVEKK